MNALLSLANTYDSYFRLHYSHLFYLIFVWILLYIVLYFVRIHNELLVKVVCFCITDSQRTETLVCIWAARSSPSAGVSSSFASSCAAGSTCAWRSSRSRSSPPTRPPALSPANRPRVCRPQLPGARRLPRLRLPRLIQRQRRRRRSLMRTTTCTRASTAASECTRRAFVCSRRSSRRARVASRVASWPRPNAPALRERTRRRSRADIRPLRRRRPPLCLQPHEPQCTPRAALHHPLSTDEYNVVLKK